MAEPKKKDYTMVLWVLWVFTKKASEEAFWCLWSFFSVWHFVNFWWVFLVLCDAEIHIWLLWLSLLAAMSHITKDGTLGLGRYFSSSILVF
jgi:hypothetical protein